MALAQIKAPVMFQLEPVFVILDLMVQIVLMKVRKIENVIGHLICPLIFDFINQGLFQTFCSDIPDSCSGLSEPDKKIKFKP